MILRPHISYITRMFFYPLDSFSIWYLVCSSIVKVYWDNPYALPCKTVVIFLLNKQNFKAPGNKIAQPYFSDIVTTKFKISWKIIVSECINLLTNDDKFDNLGRHQICYTFVADCRQDLVKTMSCKYYCNLISFQVVIENNSSFQ